MRLRLTMVAQNPKGEAAAAGIGRKRGRGEKEKMDKKEKGEKKGRDRKREVDRTERWESKERGIVKMGLRIVFAHTPKYKKNLRGGAHKQGEEPAA